jgi:DNA-binding NarL/FixJ family response regulator
MRVVLVGPAVERARVRAALTDGIEVVGEAPTLAAALDFVCDAFLLAAPPQRTAVSSRPRSASGPSEPEWGPAHKGENDDDGFDEPLTAREIEVLELLAEGLPNKAIAARLAISDQTVKFHVSSICGKLGAPNRTAAVRRAVRRGLITL